MGVAQKHAYRFGFLKSDRWKDFRLRALVFHGQFCAMCRKSGIPLDIHHIWYPRRKEEVWDVRPLCRNCHDLAHLKTSPKSYKEYEIAVSEFSTLAASFRKDPKVELFDFDREAKTAEIEGAKIAKGREIVIQRFRKEAPRHKSFIEKYLSGYKPIGKREQNAFRWIITNIEDEDYRAIVLETTGIALPDKPIDLEFQIVQSSP
jgi:hypothetical protein